MKNPEVILFINYENVACWS